MAIFDLKIRGSLKRRKSAGTPHLHGIAGPSRGQDVPLADDFVTVDERFLVGREGGVPLLKSLTSNEVMVGGELVMEAILSPGETIVTDVGEYRYVDPSAPAAGASRFQWMLAILAVAAVGVWTWPSIEKALRTARTAPPSMPQATHAVAPEAHPPAPAAVESGPPSESRIARARLQLAMAEQWSADGYLDLGRLFWAIEVWKEAERSLSGIEPAPEDLERARKARREAEAELDAKKKFLRDNATIAVRSGRPEEAKKILRVLLTVSQDPGDPAYAWALNHLRLLGS